mgnify:CR=1 FL=1
MFTLLVLVLPDKLLPTTLSAKRFLEKLGFVVGGNVVVVSELAGNVIVNIKDSRVAISKEMANRIIV